MQVFARFTIFLAPLIIIISFGCTQVSNKVEETVTKEVVMEQSHTPPTINASPGVSSSNFNSRTIPLKPKKPEIAPEVNIPPKKKKTEEKQKWTKAEIEQFRFYQLAGSSSAMNADFSIKGSLEVPNNADNADLSVLLFNEEGKLIAKAKVKPDKTFEFKELPVDGYSLVLSNKTSDVKANIKLIDKEDGSFLVKTEENKKVVDKAQPIKEIHIGDKLTPVEIEELLLERAKVGLKEKRLSGTLASANKKVPTNNVELYVVDERGTVVAKTTSDSKGNFDFSELPEGSYSLVQGNRNPAISASVAKTNNDDSGLIVPFTPGKVLSADQVAALPSAKIESGSFPAANNDVKGKVFRNQTMRQEVGQSVWLVDDNGQLIASVIPDKDGVFVFRNLKAQQYTVVVENGDNNNAFVDIISPEQSYQKEFSAKDDSSLIELLSKPIDLKNTKPNKGEYSQSLNNDSHNSIYASNQSYERGLQKMKQNDFDGAKKDFLTAIELRPDFVDAYIAQGKAFELTKNYDEAIVAYNNVLEFRPNNLSALYRRAYVENEKGDYENAIKDFTTVISLYPDYSYPYFYRAVAENQTGDHVGALRDYQKMITIDSSVQEAYFNEGSTYFQLNQYSKAVESYDKALKLDSTDADVYYNRGQVQQIQGFYEDAISDFNKAILNGPIKNAYYEKANTYALIPDEQLAIKCYNEAVTAYPHDGDSYMHRGVYYYNVGNTDAALEDFNKSIELNGKMGEYYFKRGVVLAKVKRTDEACSDFSTAKNLNYHDPEEQFFKKKYCKNKK